MGLFSRKKKTPDSKDIARERLKLVLLHDRADLSPALVERMKNEIVDVLEKYVEIDRFAMDVELRPVDARTSALVANIPIRTTHTRR